MTHGNRKERESPATPVNLRVAIKRAIDAEEHGHRFYKTQADLSVNPLAKALLEELAEDELRHCMWFKELGREVEGEPDPIADTGCVTLEDRLKTVFAEMDESARGRTDKSQEDVLKEAVRLEKESYATYDGLFRDTAGETKDLFDRIRREEFEHLAALENILQYLTKTGMWFDVEESKRWNWMV